MNPQDPSSGPEDRESAERSSDVDLDRERPIEGERGIPSVNRIRSMQSRVTGVLAIGFVSLMTLGLLAWYYTHHWQKTRAVREQTQSVSRDRAKGEMKLPPLPRVQPPRLKPPETAKNAPASTLWGVPPPPPRSGPAMPLAYRPQTAGRTGPPPDRRLTGPVLSDDEDSSAEPRAAGAPSAVGARAVDPFSSGTSSPSGSAAGGSDTLGALLRPTATTATFARVLPTQQLLLPKGAFIDCTLETALDSSLRGLVTCVTPTDVFGADGSTVLLERGTKLTGETRGEARQGLARIFVLWTEARTPSGVVAALDSPGTDELGRAGLPGQVQRHFFERFGAALLISVIEGAIQRASRPDDGDTVILNPSTTSSVATEVLKSTVNIPPTILKHNGDRIQILVARDVDFRSVYELRPTAASR